MIPDSSLVARIFEPVHQKLDAHQFSGAVLVQRGDSPLIQRAVGLANRPWSIPNQLNTRFRIASISKMFTAIAILQLIEQRAFTLDTPVMPYLGLTQTQIPDEVSVYHLLTMTAGIADWFDETGDWINDWRLFCQKHPIHLIRKHPDYLPLFIHKPMVNRPGVIHQYNNASYILLGCMIEQVTGLSYFDYVRRYIFAPAQMQDSGFVAVDSAAEAIAEGYMPVRTTDTSVPASGQCPWRRNIYCIMPEAAADSGAISTVQDLQRFSVALRSGLLLSPAGTQTLLTPKVLEEAQPYRGYIWKYGFGNFFLLDGSQQVIRWGHTGEEEGVSSRFYHYPQFDIDVVILSNQSESAADLGWEIHDAIVRHLG